MSAIERNMTVKEYAEEQHISEQCVYRKISSKKKELKGHAVRSEGKIMLDDFAQELLKPVGGNYQLIAENTELKNRNFGLGTELANLRSDCLDKKSEVTKLQNELSEKNAEIRKLKERIEELSEKCTDYEKIKERLEKLFEVFEDSKNAGLVRKIGNYISKG